MAGHSETPERRLRLAHSDGPPGSDAALRAASRRIRAGYLRKIAQALGVEPAILLARIDESAPDPIATDLIVRLFLQLPDQSERERCLRLLQDRLRAEHAASARAAAERDLPI